MRLLRPLALLLVSALALGPLALDAFARGGGPGGGGRGGGPGGGRGGPGGMRGGPGGMRGGMGGMRGGMGGTGGQFSMGRRQGQNGKTAKEWEALQNLEERKKMIAERRERLMEQDRKVQQEALLASERLANATQTTMDDVR